MNRIQKTATLAVCLTAAATAQAGGGHGHGHGYCNKTFEVSITNLTYSQVLSPPLAVAHSRSRHLYEVGASASEGLEALAEGGETMPLMDELLAEHGVCDAVAAGGPVLPGQTGTIRVYGSNRDVISVATMLVNTNDAFAAVNGVPTPRRHKPAVSVAPAYDAGTEENDEHCANVPGPACGGEGTNLAEDGEGFVHVHRGIHGGGDLDPAIYDWRNPVARIEVRRVR